MNKIKIFFFKVVGLYGIIVSITSFIIETLHIINYLRVSNLPITLEDVLKLIQRGLWVWGYGGLYLLLTIIIGSFIMFFIGKSLESKLEGSRQREPSLEHQVVGIFLLFSAIMSIPSLIHNISLYFQYEDNNYFREDILSIYLGQIFITLIPIIAYSVIGILLLTYSYRKRVVYNLTKNE